MCINLYEQPELVKAVADKLGEIINAYNTALLKLDKICAIFQGEDFGYNNQTLISPQDIRKYFLPWHKIFAKQVHDAGRMYLLHSCGKIDDIMDDLIYNVRIDGKHSFQDNVMPVEEYKKRWGDRIALLGGIDVHALSTLGPEDLRKYVRTKIDACAPGGGLQSGREIRLRAIFRLKTIWL